MEKVLIANRDEIALRVVRACRDLGLRSVVVYAGPDRDALPARLADEAYALPGAPAAAYLDIGELLAVARRCGADAVHPGYGFLAESAQFARAVVGEGLTWIGPPPEAIEVLGDKVSARRVASRVGAPVLPGTLELVTEAAEVDRFAAMHGLPVAIKAAFGGGGRGMRVVRDAADIPDALASAVREATAAFGRGECFVESYLDRPRHVETQCLADQHGTVLILSTRDCSVQRRHQKLVEEAPAPFLTTAQQERLYAVSRAILAEVGYVGAGTCEFLLGGDGTLSFLEVNTRLQVEHPVTEEVTDIDIVAEQLRVAAGERIGIEDPLVRRHAIEFRVTAEDPARGFLPAPGTLVRWRPPAGPGIRVDTGMERDATVGQSFDSLLAKLVVTGADREQALRRARRALDEFDVAGVVTTLPFHRVLVDDPAFAPPAGAGQLLVHTRWVEQEFDPGCLAAPDPAAAASPGLPASAEPLERVSLTIEVDRRRVEVTVPAGLAGALTGPARRLAPRPGGPPGGSGRPGGSGGPAAGGAALESPMQGTVVKVAVGEGDRVAKGQLVVMLEAMKMEQPVNAHRAGTVRGLTAAVGEPVAAGAAICELVE